MVTIVAKNQNKDTIKKKKKENVAINWLIFRFPLQHITTQPPHITRIIIKAVRRHQGNNYVTKKKTLLLLLHIIYLYNFLFLFLLLLFIVIKTNKYRYISLCYVTTYINGNDRNLWLWWWGFLYIIFLTRRRSSLCFIPVQTIGKK